jgi:hypothetical protein
VATKAPARCSALYTGRNSIKQWYGCEQLAAAAVPAERPANTCPIDQVLEWAGGALAAADARSVRRAGV